MRREIEGYFTVEAAMVFPVVLMTIVSVVFLLFFQYNRCLMEQDIGVLAVRGASLQLKDNEDRLGQLKNQANEIYVEKYIAWENSEIEMRIGKGVISVKQSGGIKFPWGVVGHGNQMAEATALYENHVVSPVSFIRNYRKIIGGH